MTCERGQRTREVVCVTAEERPIAENKCVGRRPISVDLCDMGSCAQTWFYTRWSHEVSDSAPPLLLCTSGSGSLSLSLSLSLSRSLSLPSLDFSTKVPSRQGFLRSISSLSLAKFGGMPHKFQSAKYANFFFPSVFGGVWGGCAPSSALL